MEEKQVFGKYLLAEVHAMDKSIYIASEKARRNLRYDDQGRPTEEYFIEWVTRHAPDFNAAWPISLCRQCRNVIYCHDCLKEDKCQGYISQVN